jgi:hypothetical protein
MFGSYLKPLAVAVAMAIHQQTAVGIVDAIHSLQYSTRVCTRLSWLCMGMNELLLESHEELPIDRDSWVARQ